MAFAKVDGVVTLIILAVFASLALDEKSYKSIIRLIGDGHHRSGDLELCCFQL